MLNILWSKKYYYAAVCAVIFLIMVITFTFAFKVSDFIKTVPVSSMKIQGASSEVKKIILDNTSEFMDTPILNLNLDALTYRLAKLPWIQNVNVYRSLTGKLIVNVIELNPYFLWLDDDNRYSVITTDNSIVNTAFDFKIDNLITIAKGQEALNNSSNIRFVIYKDKTILKEVKTLVYNGYRWDIVLKNGIVIKMPQDNLVQAYNQLIKANNKYNLLSKNIDYIDLTAVNKLFIKPTLR